MVFSNYNALTLSAHVFLINMMHSLLEKHYIYSFAAFNLYLSSIYYHQYGTYIGYWYDQCSLFTLVAISIYYNIIYNLPYRIPYIIIICYGGIVYYVGYCTKTLCFGDNGNFWHITIHILGSIANIITQAGIPFTSSSQETVNI